MKEGKRFEGWKDEKRGERLLGDRSRTVPRPVALRPILVIFVTFGGEDEERRVWELCDGG